MRVAHESLALSTAELRDCVACHTHGTPAETDRLRQEQTEG